MSYDNLKAECHLLAEHVMRFPSNSENLNWLKERVCYFLLNEDSIKKLSLEHKAEETVEAFPKIT